MHTKVNGESTFYGTGTGSLKPDQPAVVFLHGAGMDHTVWVLPARYFARHRYNVYALDFPGHGRSAGAALSTIEEMANWVSSAMDELEVPSAAIVGHSMGSLVALDVAAKYPEKTRTLALLGTSTPMPVSEQLLSAAEANQHDAIDMANTWSHSNFGLIGGNETPGMVMAMGGQRLLERAAEGVFFSDLNACNEFDNGAELAQQVRAESLLIIGEQDMMTAPVKALEVAENITNCRLLRLSPCGHAMLTEQPNAVLDALTTIV